jgi:hypothetical protein
LSAGEGPRARTEAGVLFEIGSGAVSGSATDQPKLQDEVEAELETRFGLLAAVEPRATCPESRLFAHMESRPWLHQWTTILLEARLLDSFARAVSEGLRKSPPQSAQNKRPGLINLAVPKPIPSGT